MKALAGSLLVHAIAVAALMMMHPPTPAPTLHEFPIEVEIAPTATATATATATENVTVNVNVRVNDPATATAMATVTTTGPATEPNPEPAPEPAPESDRWVGLPSIGEIAARIVAGDPPPDQFPDLVGRRGPKQGDDARGKGLDFDGNGGYRLDRETFLARVDRDGAVRFTDKPNIQGAPTFGGGNGALGFAGTFDITDAVMRANGEDPYRYEKHKFLEETRDLRMAMAMSDRQTRLREAVHDVSARLERLWGYEGWTHERRRRALFDLWDECAEDGDDDAALRAAAEVRASIIAFVRRNLPAESALAFSKGELDRLNAERKSRERFDPYPREND